MRQATNDQAQKDLLRKAKRVNYALLQQTDGELWYPISDQKSDQAQDRQDLLKFLADVFDARITVFDKEAIIVGTSAEQEVVPGDKVETEKYVELIINGETVADRALDGETGQLAFIAAVPMGNNKDAIENGILLEAKRSSFDLTFNILRSYLAIGGMIMFVIIIIISIYLAMYISRSISRLTTTVADINSGNYSIMSMDEHPLDEIKGLSGQLNKLGVKQQKIQEESQKVEEERVRLFAEISHELRTPLTAVQGFVEAIRDGVVQDEALQDRYLETIHTQTIHITRLVDDILALSRLESGNITVEKRPVDLIALSQGVVMSMEGLAKGKNTSILFEKKTENATLIGDVDRMEQIIRNLLKNAIRATDNGAIRVGVESRHGKVVLTIEDNGVGISPDDLPHIWDRFYRVKNQRGSNLQEKGTGLGLVIVKKLVQLQDGKVDVTSELGKGTVFRISFPAFAQ